MKSSTGVTLRSCVQMRHEGQRRGLRDLAALQQAIFGRDQRAERLFRHAAPEQDRQGMHFTRAADADVRGTCWHCHPGVIVDEDSSTVERDFCRPFQAQSTARRSASSA